MIRTGWQLLLSLGSAWAMAADPVSSGIGKCIACHTGVKSLPEELRTEGGLRNHLPFTNDSVLSYMMDKTVRAHGLSPEEKSAIERAAKEGRTKIGKGEIPGLGLPSRVTPCYFTRAENEKRVALLPQNISSSSALAARLAAAIAKKALIAYDRTTVADVWHGESFRASEPPTLVDKELVIRPPSQRKYDYGMNGADEFPWKRAAGTDLANGVTSHHFIIPPESGQTVASLRLRRKSTDPDYFTGTNGVEGPTVGWQYHPGTQFVEALTVEEPGTGQRVPFEIRTRMMGQDGIWKSDVLRPFASPDELAKATQGLCASEVAPRECADPGVKKFIQTTQAAKTRTVPIREWMNKETAKSGMFEPLDLNRTAHDALEEKAEVQELDELPPGVVKALLTRTPFQSVMGRPYIKGKDGKGWSAVSKSAFHVFPKGTMTTHLRLTQGKCKSCHDTAGKHVKFFDPDKSRMDAREPTNLEPGTRAWYNYVKGNAGVFSHNPFVPDAGKKRLVATSDAALAACLGSSSGLFDKSEGSGKRLTNDLTRSSDSPALGTKRTSH